MVKRKRGPTETGSGGGSVLRTFYQPSASLTRIYTGGRLGASSTGRGQASQGKDLPTLLLCPNGPSASLVRVDTVDEEVGSLRFSIVHELQVRSEDDTVSSVALSADGRRAAVSTQGAISSVFTLDENSVDGGLANDEKANISAPAPILQRSWRPLDAVVVTSTAFDDSGALLAFGGANGSVRVYDVDRAYLTHSFTASTAVISVLRFGKGSHDIFAGSENGELVKFDLHDHAITAAMKNHVSAITGIEIMQDGRRVVSSGRDRILSIWNAVDGVLVRTIVTTEGGDECAIEAIATIPRPFSRWKHIIFVGDDAGRVSCWDVDTGRQVDIHFSLGQNEAESSIVDMAFVPIRPSRSIRSQSEQEDQHPDKSFHLVTTTRSGSVYSIECCSDKFQAEVRARVAAHLEEVYDAMFLEDGKTICVASNVHTVYLYQVSPNCIWQTVGSLSGHEGIVMSLDRNAQYFATGSRDRTARVWVRKHASISDRGSLRCVGIAEGHTDAIGAVALSHKATPGFLITGAADRTLKRWKLGVDNGNKNASILRSQWTILAHQKDINCVAVSPDDKVIATGSQDKLCRIWTADSGSRLTECVGHRRGVWSLSFSPVDRVVATASGDKTIRLWSTRTGECLRLLEGHSGAILKVVFLTNGLQLASSGADGILKLWEVKSGACNQTIDGHEDRVWALSAANDGRWLLSAGADASVRIWKDETAKRAAELASVADAEALRRQEISDAVRGKQWARASRVALSADHPRQLLQVFQDVVKEQGPDELDAIISSLVQDFRKTDLEGGDQSLLRKLFSYCRDWNTSSSTYLVSQIVLKTLFTHFNSDQLTKLFPRKEEAKTMVEALLAYSLKHYERIHHASVQTHLMDYIFVRMRGLPDCEPEVGS